MGSRSFVFASVLVAVSLACRESADSPTAPEAPPAFAAGASSALVFEMVSAGTQHTCGVTKTNLAYCWGYGAFGQLGDGIARINSLRPSLVAGGLHFVQVSGGWLHTCGITTDQRAYCWGENNVGQLGDGSTTSHSTPVPVAGGHRFRHIRAGASHTCAVTPADVGYCWGSGIYAQLGDGGNHNRLTPSRIVGGLKFRRVNAGGYHTCGVTTNDKAYCWGSNEDGQLGIGTMMGQVKPVAVAGGLSFSQVIPGSNHTCGLTTSHRAYCWGNNDRGQLGDGARSDPRLTPVAVSGGHHFAQVIAGYFHTCGVTPSNIALCWGNNFMGENGNGTTAENLTPTPVAGDLRFSGVTLGPQEPPPFAVDALQHGCGNTTANRVYCWGSNVYGQVGDGTGYPTGSRRLKPVAVVGPS